MKVYFVNRPYCIPEKVTIKAKSKKEAIKRCNKLFGYSIKIHAKKLKSDN